MYSYVVQQQDIDILQQSTRVVYAKVELLNHDLQTVNVIEGQISNDNFSIDGDSAVRRTYSCDIVVDDDTFLIGKDKNIWADRYIRVYYGIEQSRYKNIIYYLLGTFSFVDMSYSYSSTSKSLSLSCSDMMVEYNGTKSGVIMYDTQAEATLTFYAGQTFNDLLVGLCNEAGITKYNLSGIDNYTVPYDLEFGAGTTYYDVWNQLNSLYNYWEFFFDEEGTFIWRRLPTGLGEAIVLNDDTLKPLIVSESLSDSFQNIYNATEVWGRQLDITDDDRYVSSPDAVSQTSDGDNVINITLYDSTGRIVDGIVEYVKAADFPGNGYFLHIENTDTANSITVTVTSIKSDDSSTFENYIVEASSTMDITIADDINKLQITDPNTTAKGLVYMSVGWLEDNENKLINIDNFTDIAIKVNTTKAKYININKLQNIPIMNSGGDELVEEAFTQDTVYVFRYRRTATGDFKTSDTDPTYPNFYLLGQYQAHGYYEETDPNVPYSIPNLGYKAVKVIENTDLYCDEVCINQAEYETYQTTAKQDSISLTMMIVPFLEPNQKLEYTPYMGTETSEWIIKKMSWSTMSATMTLEAYRFLEDYSYVYNRKEG
jgi:hypothetical protein